jgi:hypothetical protein
MNKSQVICYLSYFPTGFQNCRQQGCCRQGYTDVFTPCFEGRSGNNLQQVNSHLKQSIKLKTYRAIKFVAKRRQNDDLKVFYSQSPVSIDWVDQTSA